MKYTDPDGKTDVYFLYVYEVDNQNDQYHRNEELSSIQEELDLLKNHLVTCEVVLS